MITDAHKGSLKTECLWNHSNGGGGIKMSYNLPIARWPAAADVIRSQHSNSCLGPTAL